MDRTQKKVFINGQIKKAQREADYYAQMVKGIKKNLEYKKKKKTLEFYSYSFSNTVEDLRIAERRKKEEENLVEVLTDYRRILEGL